MLTLSHNTNKLDKFSNKDYAMVQIRTGYIPEDFQQYTQSIVEGGPIGNFWGPRFLGVDENGQNILEDLNKDGVINEEDYQVIGNAYPDVTFGFSNTFTYKNWELYLHNHVIVWITKCIIVCWLNIRQERHGLRQISIKCLPD